MVQVTKGDEVLCGVLAPMRMLLDMMRFEIPVVAIWEPVRPTASNPAAGPVVAAHNFASHDLWNVPIMGGSLFIAHENIDADW